MDNMLWLHVILVVLVYTVSFLYPRYIGNRIGLALMLPVLAYVIITQLHDQSFDQSYLWLGLAYGLLTFIPSSWLIGTSNSVSFSGRHLVTVLRKDYPDYLVLFSFSAVMVVYEELIWRVFLVNVLSLYFPDGVVIVLASAAFLMCHTAVHNISWQSFEFTFFSLVLTTIYLVSSSLLLVLVIHWVRNYLILLNTLGDEHS